MLNNFHVPLCHNAQIPWNQEITLFCNLLPYRVNIGNMGPKDFKHLIKDADQISMRSDIHEKEQTFRSLNFSADCPKPCVGICLYFISLSWVQNLSGVCIPMMCSDSMEDGCHLALIQTFHRQHQYGTQELGFWLLSYRNGILSSALLPLGV